MSYLISILQPYLPLSFKTSLGSEAGEGKWTGRHEKWFKCGTKQESRWARRYEKWLECEQNRRETIMIDGAKYPKEYISLFWVSIIAAAYACTIRYLCYQKNRHEEEVMGVIGLIQVEDSIQMEDTMETQHDWDQRTDQGALQVSQWEVDKKAVKKWTGDTANISKFSDSENALFIKI